jgi:hypothetical protein
VYFRTGLGGTLTAANQWPRRDFALFHVLYVTAMRVSELIELDIDQYNGRYLTNVQRKGKTVTPKIFLVKAVRGYLDEYIEQELCRSVNLTHSCSAKLPHYLERRIGVYHILSQRAAVSSFPSSGFGLARTGNMSWLVGLEHLGGDCGLDRQRGLLPRSSTGVHEKTSPWLSMLSRRKARTRSCTIRSAS